MSTVEVLVQRREWSDLERLWSEVSIALKDWHEILQDQIKEAVEKMKECFRSASYYKFSEIDFDQMVNCVGYVTRFAICNTALAEFATKEFLEKAPREIVQPLLESREIKIACAGGGPGSDLIGFITAFLRKRKEHTNSILKLHATVTDRYTGWEEVLEEVKTTISQASYKSICDFDDFEWDVDFLEVDFTNHNHITRELDVFKNADVILMVKLISILKREDKEGAIEAVLRCMKPGAIFLFVDTGANFVKSQVDKFSEMEIIFDSTSRRILSMDELPFRYTNGSAFEVSAVTRLPSDNVGSPYDGPPSKKRRSEFGNCCSKNVEKLQPRS